MRELLASTGDCFGGIFGRSTVSATIKAIASATCLTSAVFGSSTVQGKKAEIVGITSGEHQADAWHRLRFCRVHLEARMTGKSLILTQASVTAEQVHRIFGGSPEARPITTVDKVD